MVTKTTVAEAEHRLGFKFRPGMHSSIRECRNIPEISRFLDDIETFKARYVNTTPTELKYHPDSFVEEIDELLHTHGPTLWPEKVTSATNWLADSDYDTLGGLWLYHLSYKKDFEELRIRLRSLVFTKLVKHYENNIAAKKRRESYDSRERVSPAKEAPSPVTTGLAFSAASMEDGESADRSSAFQAINRTKRTSKNDSDGDWVPSHQDTTPEPEPVPDHRVERAGTKRAHPCPSREPGAITSDTTDELFKMDKKTRIVDVERALGFCWEDGMNKHRTECGEIPELNAFLNAINVVKVNHVCYDLRKLKERPQKFISDCDTVLAKHGPVLWPARRTCVSWLIGSSDEQYDGLYPRDLFYPDDREQLRSLVQSLIFAKIVRFREKNLDTLQDRTYSASKRVDRARRSKDPEGLSQITQPSPSNRPDPTRWKPINSLVTSTSNELIIDTEGPESPTAIVDGKEGSSVENDHGNDGPSDEIRVGTHGERTPSCEVQNLLSAFLGSPGPQRSSGRAASKRALSRGASTDNEERPSPAKRQHIFPSVVGEEITAEAFGGSEGSEGGAHSPTPSSVTRTQAETPSSHSARLVQDQLQHPAQEVNVGTEETFLPDGQHINKPSSVAARLHSGDTADFQRCPTELATVVHGVDGHPNSSLAPTAKQSSTNNIEKPDRAAADDVASGVTKAVASTQIADRPSEIISKTARQEREFVRAFLRENKGTMQQWMKDKQQQTRESRMLIKKSKERKEAVEKKYHADLAEIEREEKAEEERLESLHGILGGAFEFGCGPEDSIDEPTDSIPSNGSLSR